MQRQPEAHETQSTTAPYQRSISGHSRQSEALGGDQRPFIGHSEGAPHQRSSEVIRGHQRLIRSHSEGAPHQRSRAPHLAISLVNEIL